MATSVTANTNVSTWDDVEEKSRGEFPVLPAGVYADCYLKDWTKETSKKGDDYYRPEYVVRGADGDEYHVWGYWDTRKARGFMKKDLAALGVTLVGIAIDAIESLEERMDDAKGADCRLRLRVRQYESEDDDGNPVMKEANDIRAVMPA